MSQIFICYSRADIDFAQRLDDSLVKSSFSVWVDYQDIRAGNPWGTDVQRGLDECEVMLVVLSPDAMDSPHVRREWHYLLDKRPIIPILWKPTKIPYELDELHRIDFHNQDFGIASEQLRQELEKKGVRPTYPTSPTRLNHNKTGNLFWLCHDVMELHRWIREGISKEWIDVGFRQSLHHARELGIDESIIARLQQLIDVTSPFQDGDWTNERRAFFAQEVRVVFNVIAQYIQGADPDFNSGPG